MRIVRQEMSSESLNILRGIQGKTIRFISGENVPGLRDTLSDYSRIVVATSDSAISIELAEWESDFRGFDDDYGQILVKRGDAFVAETLASGNLSYRLRDARILEVHILREEITHWSFEVSDWKLVSDVGVALVTDRSSVVVHKAGYQSFLLEAVFAPTLTEVAIVDRNHQWNFSQELGEAYDFNREYVLVT